MVDDTSQRAGTWCFMADSPATTAKTALCARSRAELVVSRGRLSLVVYPTGTALLRYERGALPAPCSMAIRTHKIGVYSYHRHAGAVSGHTMQSWISPQLSDNVRFHENERPRHAHAGCHARSRQHAGRRRRSMSRWPAGTPAFAHGALEKVPPSRPLRPRTVIPLGGVGFVKCNLLEVQRDKIWMQN